MDLLKCLVLLVGVFQVALCYRSRSHPHCVPITARTAPLCANLSLGYDKMMLPNFLRHDTPSEVRRELAQWNPLVGSGCHPYLKLFLCSVIAPVCMPELIPPCRSLCSMVRNSCEPLMRRHNYTWPTMLDCPKYPENNMCVKIEPAKVCALDGPKVQFETLQKTFCDSDFAMRARINERKLKDGSLILKVTPSKVIKGSFRRGQVHRLRIPQSATDECKSVHKPRKHLLIIGTRKRRRMIVTSIIKWKDFRSMGRKLQKRACRSL